MKKQLLAIAMLGMGMANAQTWSENFSTATAPNLPANWVQLSLDNLTPNSAVASYSFSATRGWVSRNATSLYPTYGNVAASTSWYATAGISNDWLITPSFTVPTGSYFEWESIALDPSFPDSYRVMISTTGTATSAFTTTLLTVNPENSAWTARSINLSAYVGQTVNIAFQNYSNDMYLLYIDNVKCLVPAVNDGNVVSITSLPRYVLSGNQTVSGVFKNKGSATVNNASMRYRVDNGPVTSQTITMPGLTYLQTANYSFTTPANLTVGTHTIKAWVDAVNGVTEANHANDTAVTVVYAASTTKVRNALIEEWSSSTCNPCAALNVNFDPLCNSNTPNTGGRVNVIKYQVNWPAPGNDPSYNADAATRVTYYGINAAPTAMTNGTTDMVNHNQAEIDAAKAVPAYADITATLNVVGTTITGSANVTPYVTIPTGSPLKVHQVLAQKNYSFTNPSTSQTSFFHVMRKMYPDGNGAAFTPADAVSQTVNFTHNATYATIVTSPMSAQNSANFWNTTNMTYEYIVFLQDAVSNDILQSGSATAQVSTGLVEIKGENKIGVYPNPAKDFAVVGIKLTNPSPVEMTIIDITGKVVYADKAVEVGAGQNEIKINTSEFSTGTYNVMVKTAEGTFTEKLIVTK